VITVAQAIEALNRTGKLMEKADCCVPIGFTYELQYEFGDAKIAKVVRQVTKEEFAQWCQDTGLPEAFNVCECHPFYYEVSMD
jgi:hypothetical protein